MKLTTFFLFFFAFCAMATPAESQRAKVSIKKLNVALVNVLNEIEYQTNYLFVYSKDVNTSRQVSVKAHNISVENILHQLFDSEGISYSVEGNYIILKKHDEVGNSTMRTTPQQIPKIKGIVLDSKGEPLIGVSVRVPGMKTGVITDINGNFTIEVRMGETLAFSYVGYKTISVAAKSGMRVILEESNQSLNEVVVVGYGTQKRVNLTGSVSSVDFGKEALSRPVTTVSAALAGLSAGLQVLQSSGRPNSEGVGINIRGVGTLNSSSPLVLVDGMEESLSDVNPNDIANISILKDAASCAIYGNRGANGVILVTTKSGTKGQVRVTYSGKFSYNTPSKLIKFVSNYADYMQYMNESATNVGAASIYSQTTIDKWRTAEKDPNALAASGYPNYVAYPNTDWYDEIYQNKIMSEHSVSVLGNEGRTNYNITMTYLNNPGVIKNAGVKKYFVNTRITSNITPWLQIGTHMWGYHTDQQRNDVSNLTAWSFLKSVPGIYPYYDGKYGGIESDEEDPAAGNPLLNLDGNGDSYYKYNHLYSTAHAQIKFLKDFIFKTVFGYDYYQTRQKYSWIGQDQWSFSRDEKVSSKGSLDTDPVYMYHQEYYNWKLTSTLNWTHTYGLHDISALLGFEEGKYYESYTDVEKQGIIDPSITDLSTVTTMKYISGTDTQNRFRSYFGRVNYAYKSKYLLEGDFRRDGSSRFAKGHRWGFFPSVSAGWRISEEDFMKDSGFDNLKLRASIGKLGNNSVDDYAYQSLYNSDYTIMNGNKVSALYQGTLANEDISWEKTTTYDMGVDFALLNNRFTGVIDFYNKDTNGILYRPNIYLTLGQKTAPLENLARVNNRGLEVTLGWHDTIGKVKYSLSGNIAFNRNRVTKYKGQLIRGWVTDENGNKTYSSNLGNVSSGSDQRILQGKPVNDFYLYSTYKGSGKYYDKNGNLDINGGPRDGMIRTKNDMDWLQAMIDAGYKFLPNNTIGKGNIYYGDYIFADKNGDGVYGNSYDQDFYNVSTNPKVNFGFQGSAYWKGFDFSMNWSGASGFKIYWREVGQNACATVYGLELPASVAKDHYFYDPDNPDDSRTNLTSKNPRLALNNGDNQSDQLESNLYLYNCKFIKLRNLTIGYTLPKALTRGFYTQNIRFYVSGENLLTITPFKGLDPEMRAGSGYTTLRQYAFGVNVTF